MHRVRENLANVWTARRGLVVLVVVGALVAVLAVAAPAAWATPRQKRLEQGGTITAINGNPEPGPNPEFDCVPACEGPLQIETLDQGFGSDVTESGVTFYVTNNIVWPTDTPVIGEPGVEVYSTGQVDIVNGHFSPNPVTVWESPEPGYYDVFIDVNAPFGELNEGDGILGAGAPGAEVYVGAGICVVECPVGGATVPAGIGLPSLVLALAVLVGVGGGAAIIWKRHKA